MRTDSILLHSVVCLLALATLPSLASGDEPDPPTEVPGEDSASQSPERKYATRAIRGQVVWMYEALERRFGIKGVREATDRVLALETKDGSLHPLVEDVRGRSFRLDERLRGSDVELLVRKYQGSPMIQVIRIYALKKSGKFEVDYWCDVCSFRMFELKACDCCQGPIELRQRRVGD